MNDRNWHRMNDRNWHRPPRPAYDSEAEDGGPESGMTEGEYLQDLAHSMKPVVVHLKTGEIFQGSIEYYDVRFIRLTRKGAPNLFIFKHDIKYICEP